MKHYKIVKKTFYSLEKNSELKEDSVYRPYIKHWLFGWVQLTNKSMFSDGSISIIDRVKKFFGRFGLEDGNNLKLSERNTDNEETSIGEQENVIKEESFEDKLKLEYDINVSTSYNENNSLVDGKKERIGRD